MRIRKYIGNNKSLFCSSQIFIERIDKTLLFYQKNNIICSLQNPDTLKPIPKERLNNFWRNYYAEMRKYLKVMRRYVSCPFDLEENQAAEEAAKKFFNMYNKIFYNFWN